MSLSIILGSHEKETKRPSKPGEHHHHRVINIRRKEGGKIRTEKNVLSSQEDEEMRGKEDPTKSQPRKRG
jgi:hypothetical protein